MGPFSIPYGQALKPAARRDVGGAEEDACPRRGLSDGGRVAVEERRLISAVYSRSSIERASRPF